MKYCPKCKIDKECSEFHKNKTTKDGLARWCKSCKKDADATISETSREKKRKSSNEWRKNNLDHCNQYCKQWNKKTQTVLRNQEKSIMKVILKLVI